MNRRVFLILGFGNPLRRDDGVATYLLDGLEALGPDVGVEVRQQLTPELAETLADLKGIVFVDADRRGEPGHVRCETLTAEGASSRHSSHELDPAVLIEYTKRLYGRCPKAIVVTVAGKDFGVGTGLSEEVAAAIPLARERIVSAIEKWRSKSLQRRERKS